MRRTNSVQAQSFSGVVASGADRHDVGWLRRGVFRPCVHQLPPPIEEVRPVIRGFRLIADCVRERLRRRPAGQLSGRLGTRDARRERWTPLRRNARGPAAWWRTSCPPAGAPQSPVAGPAGSPSTPPPQERQRSTPLRSAVQRGVSATVSDDPASPAASRGARPARAHTVSKSSPFALNRASASSSRMRSASVRSTTVSVSASVSVSAARRILAVRDV